MLSPPIPFVIFLLLIVKSGMDAVSFAAKYAIRPSCICCADTLLLHLILWLDDGSGSMTVFFFHWDGCFSGRSTDLFCFLYLDAVGGGVFLFLLEVLSLVTLLQLIHPLRTFWAVFWLHYPTVLLLPGFCQQGLIEGLQWHGVWIVPCLIFFLLQLMPLYLWMFGSVGKMVLCTMNFLHWNQTSFFGLAFRALKFLSLVEKLEWRRNRTLLPRLPMLIGEGFVYIFSQC